MLRCCLEDEAVRDFGVDPAPAPSCVDGLEVAGKETIERGVPGIEGGRGNVVALAAGVSTVGADADVASGEGDRWGAEK